MTWIDWIIVAVLAASVLAGVAQGFLRAAFALGGLLAGLVLGAWNYPRVAAHLFPLIHPQEAADAIGFLLIAAFVMALGTCVGIIVAKTVHQIGLGCLDRLAGGFFGFFQGIVLVTLGLVAVVAFFPPAHWMEESRLPKLFFGACDLSTRITPSELSQKVRQGLYELDKHSPQWMQPDK